MTEQELKTGAIVCHTKHNRNYKILSMFSKMKDSQKGWIDCVVYSPMYPNYDADCFCREKQSFLEEFEIVEL